MDLFESLYERRSIRKFTDKTVPKETIEKIIEAGMYAPSAVNKQPWHFIVFKDIDTIKKIKEVHPSSGMLEQASAGILICFDKNLQHDEGFGPIDCSAATQNMLLASHGLGLGACWIGIFPRTERVKVLSNVFDLPEHVIPFAVIALGYPNEKKEKPERFKPERIHYERWSQ